jgi:hypothetical protein
VPTDLVMYRVTAVEATGTDLDTETN